MAQNSQPEDELPEIRPVIQNYITLAQKQIIQSIEAKKTLCFNQFPTDPYQFAQCVDKYIITIADKRRLTKIKAAFYEASYKACVLDRNDKDECIRMISDQISFELNSL